MLSLSGPASMVDSLVAVLVTVVPAVNDVLALLDFSGVAALFALTWSTCHLTVLPSCNCTSYERDPVTLTTTPGSHFSRVMPETSFAKTVSLVPNPRSGLLLLCECFRFICFPSNVWLESRWSISSRQCSRRPMSIHKVTFQLLSVE